MIRDFGESILKSVTGQITEANRAARILFDPPPAAVPVKDTCPNPVAPAVAVKKTVPVDASSGIRIGIALTPIGSPSTFRSIAPLNPSTRFTTTYIITVCSGRITKGKTGTERSSPTRGKGAAKATREKSGVSRRRLNRNGHRG